MDTNQLRFVLEELSFSADLPAAFLSQLAVDATLEQAPAGGLLFREGSQNDNLYLVRSGRLALEMNVLGRGAVRILTLGPGEMVGWSSLLNEGKMTASAVAVEDTEVVVAPADKLRALSEANHDFGFHLMRQMAAALSMRLVATRFQLLDLFADSSPTTSDSPTERDG